MEQSLQWVTVLLAFVEKFSSVESLFLKVCFLLKFLCHDLNRMLLLSIVVWGLYVCNLVGSVDVRSYFTGITLLIIPTTNTTQNEH